MRSYCIHFSLFSQHNVAQRASGWRLYSISAQLEDVVDAVGTKHSKLLQLQKSIKDSAAAVTAASASSTSSSTLITIKSTKDSKKTASDPLADELRSVNEFYEGNLQRCKLLRDQMDEAKDAMLKVLEHKSKAMDIIKKHQIINKKKKTT